MGNLVIKLNNETIERLELEQGDIKIGRKPGSGVLLDHAAVSGEHANIFTVGDDSFIQDLNSTNGTFVNAKRITKHHLRNGDVIMIGKHTLEYSAEPSVQRNADYAKTVIINTAEAKTPSPAPISPAAVAPRNGALTVLSGSNSGKRIELTHAVTNLGKTGKRAGTITATAEGYLISAVANSEPLRLNGRPVSEKGTKLRNGDIIEAAGTRLQFYINIK